MKKKRLKTQATHEELLLCMNYLHGDVVDHEFEAACLYEYAKESVVLREAARLWASKKHSYEESEEIALAIENRFPSGFWWSLVWQCPSFPRKSWNQLSQRKRANILLWFPSTQVQPLRVNEVWHLVTRGILDQLNTIAAKVMETYRLGKPQRKVYPIIEGPIIVDLSNPKKKERVPLVHVIFTLDFSKTKNRLRQEFDKWLQLPENKARFDAHERNLTGETGGSKDRLKDLATWRLYRELGCNEALEFSEKNRKRDKYGTPRPFHDPRQGQSKKVSLNQAALYSEESGFLKAKARATAYIAKLIPWEFGKFAEDAEKSRNELAKVFRGALKAGSEDF